MHTVNIMCTQSQFQYRKSSPVLLAQTPESHREVFVDKIPQAHTAASLHSQVSQVVRATKTSYTIGVPVGGPQIQLSFISQRRDRGEAL